MPGLSSTKVAVKTCEKRTEVPGWLRQSTTGEELTNVKSREWIAIKPASDDVSLEELWTAAGTLSKYVIAAEFADGLFAIVRKPYSKDGKVIPQGFKAVAVCEGRTVTEKVVAAMKYFLGNARKFITNVQIEDKVVRVEIMTLEEVLDAMKDVNPYKLDTWTAAARRARASKHLEEPDKKALYEGIMVQMTEVKSHFAELEAAQLVVNRLKDKKTWDINDSLWDDCQDAKATIGWGWDPNTKECPEMTMDVWANSPAHLNQSALLVGAAAAGKTQIIHALGKTYCIRYELPLYCYAKALDPFGVLTRSGTTGQSAFFGWSDFDMTTLRNDGLSKEELKSVFDAQEGGSHRARYHVATYPRKTAKAFGINATTKDCAEIFQGMGLDMFAYLMLKDKKKLAQLSATDQAIARRVVIFPIEGQLISKEHIKKLENKDAEKVNAGKQREKEWIQKFRPA